MNNEFDKVRRIEALKNGKGIQYLLSEAYEIFGNPILMHDLDYKVLAYTENTVSDDLLWNELITTGAHSEESIELFGDEGFIDIVANSKTIAYLASDKIKYDRLFGKVYNKLNIVVGAVDVVACYKPIEDDDPAAFEAFCKVLSREVGKSEFYQTYGEMYHETLIGKLIDRDIEDKKLYPAHVETVYNGLKANLFLAVVDTTHCDPEHASLSNYRDLFKKTQPAHKYTIYSNYILIIISTDEQVLDVNKELSKLNRLFHRNNIYAGISSCFDNLFELQKYYQEALSALSLGIEVSNQRIFLYDQFK